MKIIAFDQLHYRGVTKRETEPDFIYLFSKQPRKLLNFFRLW